MGKRQGRSTHRRSDPLDFSDDLDRELHALKEPLPRPAVLRAPVRPVPHSDRRLWAPTRDERAREETGRPARIVYKSPRPKPRNVVAGKASAKNRLSNARFVNDRPYFARPVGTSVCQRRKARRETLFAKKLTGKGSRSPKKRNLWSDISC